MKLSSEDIIVEQHFLKHPSPQTMLREGQLPHSANKGEEVNKAKVLTKCSDSKHIHFKFSLDSSFDPFGGAHHTRVCPPQHVGMCMVN